MVVSCTLSLPLPTSLNKLYVQQFSGGRFTGKKILSKEGKQNREDIKINVEAQMSLPINVDWDFEYTIDNYIYMDIDAYVTRSNADTDNYLKSLKDSIEESRLVFDNDKRVVERFNRVYVDANNPRLELKFTQTGWHGIFDNEDVKNRFIQSNCETCSRFRNGACSLLKKSLDNKIQQEIIYNNNEYNCSKRKVRK